MLALVTDSTCGLTKVEAQELGVEMVPVVYVVDGTRREEGFVGQNAAQYRSTGAPGVSRLRPEKRGRGTGLCV